MRALASTLLAAGLSHVLLAQSILAQDQPALDPFSQRSAKAVVLLFVRSDCPISNRYAPEVRRLYERYSPRDVRFYLVYPDRDESVDSIAKHKTEYGYPLESIRDPKRLLAARAQAKVTPEAAVFVPSAGKPWWQLVYHGRIDDRYVDFGKSRPEPKVRDLDEALTAVLAGKPVKRPETKAVGCYLSDLR